MRLAAAFYLVAFLTATWGQPELFSYGTDQGDEELSNCDDCNSGMVSLQHDVQMYGNNHSSYVVSCRVVLWSMVCWKCTSKEKCRSVACWFRGIQAADNSVHCEFAYSVHAKVAN